MQKSIIAGALVALFLVATLGPAAAQDQARSREGAPRPGSGQRFAAMDTDGNGEISQREFMQASKERAKRMFGTIDANGDGVITQEEMRAAGPALREGRRPQGGGEGAVDRPQRRRRQQPAPAPEE